jgi:hypothetical protein
VTILGSSDTSPFPPFTPALVSIFQEKQETVLCGVIAKRSPFLLNLDLQIQLGAHLFEKSLVLVVNESFEISRNISNGIMSQSQTLEQKIKHVKRLETFCL